MLKALVLYLGLLQQRAVVLLVLTGRKALAVQVLVRNKHLLKAKEHLVRATLGETLLLTTILLEVVALEVRVEMAIPLYVAMAAQEYQTLLVEYQLLTQVVVVVGQMPLVVKALAVLAEAVLVEIYLPLLYLEWLILVAGRVVVEIALTHQEALVLL
jgi:hypothetical protein